MCTNDTYCVETVAFWLFGCTSDIPPMPLVSRDVAHRLLKSYKQNRKSSERGEAGGREREMGRVGDRVKKDEIL